MGPVHGKIFLDEKGEGVHHIAFFVKGTDTYLQNFAKNGMATVQTGDYTGGRYSYVESSKQLATVVELLENF